MLRTRTGHWHLIFGIVLAFAFLVLSAGPSGAGPACNSYNNSSVVIGSSGAVYCGSTGSGCTECVTFGGGGGGGPTVCWGNGFSIICTDGSGGYYLV